MAKRMFDARYDGECGHCGAAIEGGWSRIGYVDDEIACETCCDESGEFDDD